MNNTTTTVLVAVGALLVGGVATAAYMNNRGDSPEVLARSTYAEVLKVDPITQKEQLYASVVGSDPVRENSPHEVCRDVVVQERLPERDGNVGGTVAGAVIGGLLGNQIGGGDGRKVATAAGAVAGGVIGNRVDRNHVGGRVANRTERRCHTENSSRVVGYTVTYRNADGTTGTLRMNDKPGDRVALGQTDAIIGYDVTYRYEGQQKTLRMQDKPDGNRLPVVDGQVVAQNAAGAEASATHH